jgi:hypothetical protein
MAAREWYRPLPPPRDILWSLRNNTNYMETGVLAALELTASFSKTVLENFYQKSRNSIQSGETEAPFGYVLPAGQPDMTRVAFVVNTLRLQGIEVGRATAEFKIGSTAYPAGSLVVKRNQPYGRLAKILLEKQNFPEGNLTTYDDTGWTMGLMSHAEVKEIADKAILDVKTQPVDKLEITGTVRATFALILLARQPVPALPSQGCEVRSHRQVRQGWRRNARRLVSSRTAPASAARSPNWDSRPSLSPGPRRREASARVRASPCSPPGAAQGRVGALRVRQIRDRLQPHLQGAR